MTVELKEEQIPEEQLKVLVQTAVNILKKGKEQYAFVYCKVANGCYVAYLYIENNEFKSCYFFTNDIIRNYMKLLQASPLKAPL